jgi:hypothetical protein
MTSNKANRIDFNDMIARLGKAMGAGKSIELVENGNTVSVHVLTKRADELHPAMRFDGAASVVTTQQPQPVPTAAQRAEDMLNGCNLHRQAGK